MRDRARGHGAGATPSPMLLLLLSLLEVGGCATAGVPDAPRRPKLGTSRPRLVVLLPVDQLRYDFIPRLLPFLPKGGIARLVREGAQFTDLHYEYGTPFTGPGHAVLATGAYADRNGIVSNRYFDQALGRMVQPADDPETREVGAEGPGASPKNLMASTVGDELRLADARSKVIAISLKDRASVMLAGHRGQAVWFDRRVGRWVSSTWYGARLPSWVQAANARHDADAGFGQVWTEPGPKAAYASASRDDAPWEYAGNGLGRTFPRRLVGSHNTRDESYYRAWAQSPWALKAQLRLAAAAIESEALGQDAIPDLLALSLSSFDYIGHNYGPHSHEAIALFFAVDDFVRGLLTLLDERVGAGHYVVALTADHGTAAVPEYLKSLKINAGRLFTEDVHEAVSEALQRRYGPGAWLGGIKLPWVALSEQALRAAGIAKEDAEQVAAEAVSALDGVAAVLTATALQTGAYVANVRNRNIGRSLYPGRSGSLYVVPQPHWVFSYRRYPLGTAHGTPYRYDTHVPLLLYGAGIRPGTYAQRAEAVDIAATLSHILRTTRPDQCQGRVLTEALAP